MLCRILTAMSLAAFATGASAQSAEGRAFALGGYGSVSTTIDGAAAKALYDQLAVGHAPVEFCRLSILQAESMTCTKELTPQLDGNYKCYFVLGEDGTVYTNGIMCMNPFMGVRGVEAKNDD